MELLERSFAYFIPASKHSSTHIVQRTMDIMRAVLGTRPTNLSSPSMVRFAALRFSLLQQCGAFHTASQPLSDSKRLCIRFLSWFYNRSEELWWPADTTFAQECLLRLPKDLWQSAKRAPDAEEVAIILDILALVSRASGAEQHDGGALGIVVDAGIMAQLQAGLVPLLCTFLQPQGKPEVATRRVYGPFAGLSEERQKQVISFFYYMPSVSAAAVKALTAVCGRRGMEGAFVMELLSLCV